MFVYDFISKNKIELIIFFIFSIIYSLTICSTISLTHDSITYVLEIERRMIVLHPHHLLYHIISLLWYEFILLFFRMIPAYKAIALLNAISGAAILSVVYHFENKILNISKTLSIVSVLTIGFSFGFWFYSINVEVYILPIFFFILSIVFYYQRLEEKKNIYFSLIFASISVLFHQIYIIYVIILVFLIIKDTINPQKRIMIALRLSLIIFFIIALPYIYSSIYLGHDSIDRFFYWLTQYQHETNRWESLSSFTIVKDLIGYARTLIAPFALFKINFFVNFLHNHFASKDFDNELFLLRNYSYSTVYIFLFFAIIFLSLFIIIILNSLKEIMKFLLDKQNHLITFTLLLFSLFFSFWDSANLEFWILQSIIIWIIVFVAVNRKNNSFIKKIIIFIPFCLLNINFFFGILSATDINNDLYYAKVKDAKKFSPRPDLVVVKSKWIISSFFEKYSDLIIIDFNKFQKNIAKYKNKRILFSVKLLNKLQSPNIKSIVLNPKKIKKTKYWIYFES